MDEFPVEMWQCAIPDLYTGTGTHTDYLLINPDRPFHQNTVDHFVGARKGQQVYGGGNGAR